MSLSETDSSLADTAAPTPVSKIHKNCHEWDPRGSVWAETRPERILRPPGTFLNPSRPSMSPFSAQNLKKTQYIAKLPINRPSSRYVINDKQYFRLLWPGVYAPLLGEVFAVQAIGLRSNSFPSSQDHQHTTMASVRTPTFNHPDFSLNYAA